LPRNLPQIQHLSSVTDAEVFHKIYDQLLTEYPKHIPLLQVKVAPSRHLTIICLQPPDPARASLCVVSVQARLEFLDDEKRRKEGLAGVVAAADGVIGVVDTTELALHFGTNVDEADPKAVKHNTEMEDRKKALANALARKARAMIEQRQGGEEGEGTREPSAEEVEAVVKELGKWDSLDQVCGLTERWWRRGGKGG
jgi:hypothetical protein